MLATKKQYAKMCGVLPQTIYARLANETGGLKVTVKNYGEFIDTKMFPPNRKRVSGGGRKKKSQK